MNEALDPRTSRLASACARLGPTERSEYLDRECAGDAELRRSVELALSDDATLTQTKILNEDLAQALPEHYRLVRMIGRGGMAEVFLGEDTRLNRRVAIKFLSRDLRSDRDRMKRFYQEARSASALNHPNILTIHDIGEKDGIQFIVTEYVEGETLGSRIARGPVPIADAVDIALGVASALTASHIAGIVHRDIKPDNVMIRNDGRVKVLDFGLAKETGGAVRGIGGRSEDSLDGVMTSPGLILGTPQYMSPEQARGMPLDGRTDIFSLGIIIYEMVTGKPPFAGNNAAEIIGSIVAREPKELRENMENPPQLLVSIVERALHKERAERYGSMGQLLSDLEELKREIAAGGIAAARETLIAPALTTLHNTIRFGEVRVRFSRLLILFLILSGVAFGLWWYIKPSGSDRSPFRESMKTVGVTSWSSGVGELVSAGAFSPDGKMVAFAAAKSGSTDIWVKPTVGGDSIKVTKGGFYNQYPIWSPNGQEIAFFSSRGENRGIWRTSFTGGEQVLVAGGVGATATPKYWAKSGKIYFQEGLDLFAVDVLNGGRTRVTDFESKGLRPWTIEIAADETKIAYSIRENDLWKIKVKGIGAEVSVDMAVSRDQLQQVAWGRDGNKVVFSASVEGTYQIFESGPGRVEPVQLSNGTTDSFVQDVSEDGKRILFGSVNETSDLWSVNVQDSKEMVVADDVAAEYWAEVSPDGRSVAYQSVKQPDRPFGGAIGVKPLAAAEKMITLSPSGFAPVWSKDGNWIAYFRRGEAGIDLWRVRPTGDDALRLAEGTVQTPGYTATPYLKIGTNHLGWSPDGVLLAYPSRDNELSNIRLVSADGLTDTPLTVNRDPGETFCCPIWTNDGKSIVFSSEFTSGGSKGSRIWLADIGGGEPRTIATVRDRIRLLGLSEGGKELVYAMKSDVPDSKSASESVPVYLQSLQTTANTRVNSLDDAYFHNIHLSPDGRSIAFVSRRGEITTIGLVQLDGGKPRKLLVVNDPKTLISSLAWSPDGKAIVFGKQTRTTLLSMLEE